MYKQQGNKLMDAVSNNTERHDDTKSQQHDTSTIDKGKDSDDNNEEKLPPKKKAKKSSKALTLKHSSIKFADVGGMDRILREVFQIFVHLKADKVFQKSKMSPVRGILLHGPPGCGKTYLAHAIAGQMNIPLVEVAATELVCGNLVSLKEKSDTFDEAIKTGRCILFIDEIDAIFPKRENASGVMEKRMVSQLVKCFDELKEKDPSNNVTVIAATNIPDSIEPVLRRQGRFERDLPIGIPNEESRLKILQVLCKDLTLEPGFNLSWLAHHTPGYVGADLNALILKAFEIGLCRLQGEMIRRFCMESNIDVKEKHTMDDFSVAEIAEWFDSPNVDEEELEKHYFKLEDFQAALKICIPFCKREGFASVPDVTWEEIGALENVKEQLQAKILRPVKYPKLYEDFTCTKGILLYGPKGCGKTLLAKYLGESEKAVRRCFERARHSAPCVMFFDEFDALCPSRSISNSNAAAERVVNQLLTEMDGMQERKQVFVIAATNRVEKIDSAMLRPGRLEKLIYVDLPTPAGRRDILRSQTRNKTHPRIADELSLDTLAYDERCKDFSGADLAYLVREATSKARDELIDTPLASNLILNMSHFDQAFEVVKPSFNEQDRKYFEKYRFHQAGS